MSRGTDLWWQRRGIWLPAALFVLLDLGLLAGYEVALAGRVNLQSRALASRQHDLEGLMRRRRAAEAQLSHARATRTGVDALYTRRLGTQATRLTAVMLEVKHLARQAGLAGVEAINYADEPVQGLPLLRKSITFAAEGSYEQLRAFINLLELSPSFLVLDEISVQQDQSSAAHLRLQVRLSTLFVTPVDERGSA